MAKIQAPKDFRKKYSIGYGLMITTQNNYEYYDNGINNRYHLAENYNIATQLEPIIELKNEHAHQAFNSNILAMLGYKNRRHKLVFLFWNTHNTYKTTVLQNGRLLRGNGYNNYSTQALLYEQSGRLVPQLKGQHRLGREKEHLLNWSLTGQQVYNNQPDWKYFSIIYNQDSSGGISYELDNTYEWAPSRYYRTLKSKYLDAKVDASFKPRWEILDKVKIGGHWSWAQQHVVEQQYSYYNHNTIFNKDIESFLGEANSLNWNMQQNRVDKGLFIYNSTDEKHSYKGVESIGGIYAMADLKSDEGLHLSIGMRAEHTFLKMQNIDSTQQNYLTLLPAMLLSYKTNRDGWFRVGYTTTLGRPTMRELSAYTSFNYIGDYKIKGAADILPSTIHNFDLRWEWFPRMRELISVGGFFKYLQNPIDHIAELGEHQDVFVYRNLDDAWMVGTELELRKRLHFLGRWANDFYFTANFSYTYTQVSIDSSNWAEIRKQLPDAKPYRQMSKQPNYIANFILNYQYKKLGLQANLNLNWVGKKLVYATQGVNPNIYELPRLTLNCSLSKRLGRYFKLQLGVENLLDAQLQQVYEFKKQKYSHRVYPIGQTIWIGISYQFKPKV